MAEWKYYAGKGNTIEIDTGSSGVPSYTKIRCISSIGMSMGADKTDATTYESGLWKDEFLTGRSMSFSIEGIVAANSDGVRDPGQLALKRAGIETEVGHTKFRVKFAGDTDAYEFSAIVVYQEGGTTSGEFRKFTAELTVKGTPTQALEG